VMVILLLCVLACVVLLGMFDVHWWMDKNGC
jgi:hypothetical protein